MKYPEKLEWNVLAGVLPFLMSMDRENYLQLGVISGSDVLSILDVIRPKKDVFARVQQPRTMSYCFL